MKTETQFAAKNKNTGGDSFPCGFAEADHLPRELGQFRQPVQRPAAGLAPPPDNLRQCPAHRFERRARDRPFADGAEKKLTLFHPSTHHRRRVFDCGFQV